MSPWEEDKNTLDRPVHDSNAPVPSDGTLLSVMQSQLTLDPSATQATGHDTSVVGSFAVASGDELEGSEALEDYYRKKLEQHDCEWLCAEGKRFRDCFLEASEMIVSPDGSQLGPSSAKQQSLSPFQSKYEAIVDAIQAQPDQELMWFHVLQLLTTDQHEGAMIIAYIGDEVPRTIHLRTLSEQVYERIKAGMGYPYVVSAVKQDTSAEDRIEPSTASDKGDPEHDVDQPE